MHNIVEVLILKKLKHITKNNIDLYEYAYYTRREKKKTSTSTSIYSRCTRV